jgi:hypothetical protein
MKFFALVEVQLRLVSTTLNHQVSAWFDPDVRLGFDYAQPP